MDNVVARLMRYAKVWSESDYHANRGTTPSTDRQFDMARLLVEELHGMGVDNAFVDDTCYVYASLPATPGCEHLPVIGLIAHMDTTPDMTGKDVKPQVLHYEGGDLVLNPEQNIVMKGSDFPELKKFIGQDLVCTDGTTLLGADDKAGIAIILQAVKDYKKALRQLESNPRNQEARHDKVRLEKFFRSQWYGVLTELDPERLMAGVKENVQHEMNERRRKKAEKLRRKAELRGS